MKKGTRRVFVWWFKVNCKVWNFLTISKALIINLHSLSKYQSFYFCTEILDRVLVDIDGIVARCPKYKDSSSLVGNITNCDFENCFNERKIKCMKPYLRENINNYGFMNLLEICLDS